MMGVKLEINVKRAHYLGKNVPEEQTKFVEQSDDNVVLRIPSISSQEGFPWYSEILWSFLVFGNSHNNLV